LLSSDDLVFRDEVRRFLADSIPPGMGRAIDLTTAFHRRSRRSDRFSSQRSHRKGWSVPHWPVEHGGTGWSPVQRYIFDLECGSAGAATYNASGSQFSSTRHHPLRHARAEGQISPAHPLGGRLLGAGLFRTGLGLPISHP